MNIEKQDFDNIVKVFKKDERKRLNLILKGMRRHGFNAKLAISLYGGEAEIIIRKRK